MKRMPTKEAAVKCPVCKGWSKVINLNDGWGWWIVPHFPRGKSRVCGGSSRFTPREVTPLGELAKVRGRIRELQEMAP